MTDLRENIMPYLRTLRAIASDDCTDRNVARVNNLVSSIEAALPPETGPAPDPAKQFVVGETYSCSRSGYVICLFRTPSGRMVYSSYLSSSCESVSAVFDEGLWTHVPRRPELDAAIAERDAAEASLAAAEARVAELGGGE